MMAVTTAFEGLRAGVGVLRMTLDLPARASIGPIAFAAFSRATDLSTIGVIFYVLYGVGGALLTSATWFVAARTHAPAALRYLTSTAFVSSLLILAMTTQAAPLMWHVGSAGNDPALLATLLNSFTFWTNLRFLCADVSFVAVLSALTIAALRGGAAEELAGSIAAPPRMGQA
jgi:hypothetical protein